MQHLAVHIEELQRQQNAAQAPGHAVLELSALRAARGLAQLLQIVRQRPHVFGHDDHGPVVGHLYTVHIGQHVRVAQSLKAT